MPTGVTSEKLFNKETGTTNLISSIELIKREVEFLLGYQKYSLMFGNNMGFSPERFLHLSNRVATFNLIKAEISKLFAKYRRATLQNIKMTFLDETNELFIEIVLSVDSYNSQVFSVSTNISI